MRGAGDASTRPVRILLVNDHPVFLAGLRALLEATAVGEVVGDLTNGTDIIPAARRLRPDVVIFDFDDDDNDVLMLIRRISRECPQTAVLVLTRRHDYRTVAAVVRAGARGCAFKAARPGDLARAVEAVSRGEVIFGAHVADGVLRHFDAAGAEQPPFPELTERERVVLCLVADGYSTAAIAGELALTTKTVRNYLSKIFAKLEVRDRAEAAVIARRAGLGG
ncbi:MULTISPECIES: response regulator transcription factor [Protofrankia]|uniref:Two component transcriptional regulator, LuxR family n=1 Tax=Candidatus Protofrankia datiscae TaxID=2716812 RepID=F8B0H6_9ACTN|nr:MULTISPECIES: response regulator transcription factor [Protofrankia]AEH09725.1 two component transcriptional regulator, LuxR family [Candidatus Protofrankia datiscae]